MRLSCMGRVYLSGTEEVFRSPHLWDKVKFFFGSDVDLRTGELKVMRDVLELTEQLQRGLAAAGVHNAVSLVVDTDVVFQDTQGVDNDAELLVATLRRAHERFASGFKTLRMLFEHSHDGMHSLIEVTLQSKHERSAPAATIVIGSRIDALRAKPSESLEAAKDRIGASRADTTLVPAQLVLLNDFASGLFDHIQRHFPASYVESDPATAQVVSPGVDDVMEVGPRMATAAPELREHPRYPKAGHYGPYYDPWGTYYHDPMDTYVNLLMIDAMLSPRDHWGYPRGHLGTSWAHHGANVHVINHAGTPLCDGDQIVEHSAQFAGATEVMALDHDSATWDEEMVTSYNSHYVSWNEPTGGGQSYDCAGYEDAGTSWDCSSDCSYDCSSDCSWDCSSDCSWDCSSDCSWDCDSDW